MRYVRSGGPRHDNSEPQTKKILAAAGTSAQTGYGHGRPTQEERMATEVEAPIEPPVIDYQGEYEKQMDSYDESLAKVARQSGDSDLLGETIRFQRADGYARYMIMNVKPLQVCLIATGDAWQVEKPLIRGLNLSDAENMVARERAFRELITKLDRKDMLAS